MRLHANAHCSTQPRELDPLCAVYFTALAIDDIFISSFVCHSHAATVLARELAEWVSTELNPEGFDCLVPAADDF